MIRAVAPPKPTPALAWGYRMLSLAWRWRQKDGKLSLGYIMRSRILGHFNF
jgi:hypothetical protein